MSVSDSGGVGIAGSGNGDVATLWLDALRRDTTVPITIDHPLRKVVFQHLGVDFTPGCRTEVSRTKRLYSLSRNHHLRRAEPHQPHQPHQPGFSYMDA